MIANGFLFNDSNAKLVGDLKVYLLESLGNIAHENFTSILDTSDVVELNTVYSMTTFVGVIAHVLQYVKELILVPKKLHWCATPSPILRKGSSRGTIFR